MVPSPSLLEIRLAGSFFSATPARRMEHYRRSPGKTGLPGRAIIICGRKKPEALVSRAKCATANMRNLGSQIGRVLVVRRIGDADFSTGSK
jgi:hypothetical protein